MNYIGKNGIPFTEEDIQGWILEAENAFPNSTLEPITTRVWEKPEPFETHTIRVSPTIWKALETKAKNEQSTPSELVRSALTHYLSTTK